jgi:uncharacterized membrane protein (DUF2068 family)
MVGEWATLELAAGDETRLGRCVRCDAWIRIDPALPRPPLDRLATEDLPRRGRALRDAMVLRIIAVERGVHSVVFALLAIGLIVLRFDLPGLQASARHLIQETTNGLAGPAQTASRDVIQRELVRVMNLRSGTLGILIVTALAYAVIEGVEAVGLWLERRWAEYLTALATVGFVPFEIDELTKRVTAVRVGALAINLAVLAYLVWKKHLFGIGGTEPAADRVAALR